MDLVEMQFNISGFCISLSTTTTTVIVDRIVNSQKDTRCSCGVHFVSILEQRAASSKGGAQFVPCFAVNHIRNAYQGRNIPCRWACIGIDNPNTLFTVFICKSILVRYKLI